MTRAMLLPRTAALLVAGLFLSGCSFTGLTDLQLPFTKGRGDDAIKVTVVLDNATNLVPNAEVKYRELTVGSVHAIHLEDWKAVLEIGLEPDAKVPDDVTARVAQKSLLGAEYLELRDPQRRRPSTEPGYLASGAQIDLDRTGRYPETEEVLSAAAMMLNGGGLPQVQTIAREVNQMLDGRTANVRSFIRSFGEFADRLERQRTSIVGTLEELDRFSSGIQRQRTRIRGALDDLPAGVEALALERKDLVRAMRAVTRFGSTFDRVVASNDQDVALVLRNIEPLLSALANQGPSLAHAPEAAVYPFTVRGLRRVVTSDYMNLHATIEINAARLLRGWASATPLDGLLPGLVDGTPTGTADDEGNPLTDPLSGLNNGSLGGVVDGLTDGVDGLLGGRNR